MIKNILEILCPFLTGNTMKILRYKQLLAMPVIDLRIYFFLTYSS